MDSSLSYSLCKGTTFLKQKNYYKKKITIFAAEYEENRIIASYHHRHRDGDAYL